MGGGGRGDCGIVVIEWGAEVGATCSGGDGCGKEVMGCGAFPGEDVLEFGGYGLVYLVREGGDVEATNILRRVEGLAADFECVEGGVKERVGNGRGGGAEGRASYEWKRW